MNKELIGFIEFSKDLRSVSNIPEGYPVNLIKNQNYNMLMKNYDPEIYNFRTIVNYSYIIPLTTSRGDLYYTDQDVEVSLEIFAQNKKTKEDIGYFACKKLHYNITPNEIENKIIFDIVLNAKYTIITHKQGLFSDVKLLETKVPSNEFPPTYWGLFFE